MSVMVLCRIIEYNFDLVFLSSKTSTKNISMCIRDFFSYQIDSQFREEKIGRFLVEKGKGGIFFFFILPFIVEKSLAVKLLQ